MVREKSRGCDCASRSRPAPSGNWKLKLDHWSFDPESASAHRMGREWDIPPLYPTLSHLVAHNIPCQNAVSREIIQIFRRVSIVWGVLTVSGPTSGGFPLCATPGLALYPPDDRGHAGENVPQRASMWERVKSRLQANRQHRHAPAGSQVSNPFLSKRARGYPPGLFPAYRSTKLDPSLNSMSGACSKSLNCLKTCSL
jgi:hypothetical protein